MPSLALGRGPVSWAAFLRGGARAACAEARIRIVANADLTAADRSIPRKGNHGCPPGEAEEEKAETVEPGANLRQIVALPPNATFYLQVSGYGSSAGAYTLLVQPLNAFDNYEPNDDIYHAPRIALGTTIMAGIMDADDTDYYSFVSPRTGTVSVVITNRSTTLIPALSTFDPDMRSSGFGPDVRTPGRNLQHTMEVQQNQVYFIQVWSQETIR